MSADPLIAGPSTGPATDGGRLAPKRELAAWAMFDAANSAFPLVMVTAVFVLYFQGVVAAEASNAEFLWGICISGSALLVALTGPFMGALADAKAWRKRLLGVYTLVAIVATLALTQSGAGKIAYTMLFFIIANAAFEGGMVFYGSLLPSVVEPKRMGRASGLGWACGYIGGLVCLGICLGPAQAGKIPLVVGIVAVWFALFSQPLFWLVRERQAPQPTDRSPLASLKDTLRTAFGSKTMRRFLLAYFLYNDAIITTFAFAALLGASIGFGPGELIKLIMAVQLTGAIGAYAFGFVADRISNAAAIRTTLLIWIVVTACGFVVAFDFSLWEANPGLRTKLFIATGLSVGLAMGAAQSASRSFLAAAVPPEKSGEFFGLYAVAGRFSAICGPLLFGAIASATGNMALGVLALLVMFIAGLLLMRGVNDVDARRELSGAPAAN